MTITLLNGNLLYNRYATNRYMQQTDICNNNKQIYTTDIKLSFLTTKPKQRTYLITSNYIDNFAV